MPIFSIQTNLRTFTLIENSSMMRTTCCQTNVDTVGSNLQNGSKLAIKKGGN
jgi:hypothetical protein